MHVFESFVFQIRIDVIVVRVSQIDIVLFEQQDQLGVVAYELLRYPTVRQTQVKSVHNAVSSHREILAYSVLSFARYVAEQHY